MAAPARVAATETAEVQQMTAPTATPVKTATDRAAAIQGATASPTGPMAVVALGTLTTLTSLLLAAIVAEAAAASKSPK